MEEKTPRRGRPRITVRCPKCGREVLREDLTPRGCIVCSPVPTVTRAVFTCKNCNSPITAYPCPTCGWKPPRPLLLPPKLPGWAKTAIGWGIVLAISTFLLLPWWVWVAIAVALAIKFLPFPKYAKTASTIGVALVVGWAAFSLWFYPYILLPFAPSIAYSLLTASTMLTRGVPCAICQLTIGFATPEACFEVCGVVIPPPTKPLLQISTETPSVIYEGVPFTTEVTVELLEEEAVLHNLWIDAYVLDENEVIPPHMTICPKTPECLDIRKMWGMWGTNCYRERNLCTLDSTQPTRTLTIWFGNHTCEQRRLFPWFTVGYEFNSTTTYKVKVSQIETAPPIQEENGIGPVSVSVKTDAKNDVYMLPEMIEVDGKRGTLSITITNTGKGEARLTKKKNITITQLHTPDRTPFLLTACTGFEPRTLRSDPAEGIVVIELGLLRNFYLRPAAMDVLTIGCTLEVPEDVEVYAEYTFKVLVPYTYVEENSARPIVISCS